DPPRTVSATVSSHLLLSRTRTTRSGGDAGGRAHSRGSSRLSLIHDSGACATEHGAPRETHLDPAHSRWAASFRDGGWLSLYHGALRRQSAAESGRRQSHSGRSAEHPRRQGPPCGAAECPTTRIVSLASLLFFSVRERETAKRRQRCRAVTLTW